MYLTHILRGFSCTLFWRIQPNIICEEYTQKRHHPHPPIFISRNTHCVNCGLYIPLKPIGRFVGIFHTYLGVQNTHLPHQNTHEKCWVNTALVLNTSVQALPPTCSSFPLSGFLVTCSLSFSVLAGTEIITSCAAC